MLKYDTRLKPISRTLRSNMTDAEQLLWQALRRKQVLGVQFYRQKPIGSYIVDFYGPAAGLAIEVDGSGHFGDSAQRYDAKRTAYFNTQGLKVLRFNNLEVLKQLDSVMEIIFRAVEESLGQKEIPPNPPFTKGGTVAPLALECADTPLELKRSSLDELI